ncbi:aquaporin [Georgenia sp. TF02-10]|uniref:aquaporin n=1 Tax=Georgenia sp. TF02-10 TaxID=2917725 RepID=UPI001FA76801|nr:aquaporin [Georgenia sp. TF02-10]UNX55313.1 aquaporin [Georgenia sp. TF02-10]
MSIDDRTPDEQPREPGQAGPGSTPGSPASGAPAGSTSPTTTAGPAGSTSPTAATDATSSPAVGQLGTDDPRPVDGPVVENPPMATVPGRAPARPSLAVRVGAEALGTFVLVFATLGVLLYSSVSGVGTLGMALAAGLALAGATAALGHVSDGHFNPAVTLAAAVGGRTRGADVLPYWLAQILGGVAAAGAVFLTIPASLPAALQIGDSRTFFSTVANSWGEQSQLWAASGQTTAFDARGAFVVEAIATALLAAVVLGAVYRRGSRVSAPLAVGAAYAALLLVTAPMTGGSLNPARATAAALFADGALSQLWLFWVAALVGALVAGLVYRLVTGGRQDDRAEATPVVQEEPVVAR